MNVCMDIGVRCFCDQPVLNCDHFGTAIGQQDAITVLNKYEQPINNLFRWLIGYCYGQTHGQGHAPLATCVGDPTD